MLRTCQPAINVKQINVMPDKSKTPPFKILIDTCVWLDLAKDYQQQPILSALEELIRHGDVELILPRTVAVYARSPGWSS